MKKLFELFMLWRAARIVLSHHGIIGPLSFEETKAGETTPTLYREHITHEELVASYGVVAYTLWDLLFAGSRR